MRHTPAPGRSARRGGGPHTLNPQRLTNERGHDALLAQSLENPCGVSHMPTPGVTTTGGALRFWDTTDPTKQEPRVALYLEGSPGAPEASVVGRDRPMWPGSVRDRPLAEAV